MGVFGFNRTVWPALVLGLLVLSGCSSTRNKAPVEERNALARPAAAVPAAAAASAPSAEPVPAAPLPGAENAGKPGYYTVKTGDTVVRIALDHGQNWRDLVRWNNLADPNLLEVGQVLRVVPPGPDPGAVSARAVPGAGRVESRPLDAKPGIPAPSSASSPPLASVPSSPPAAATTATAVPSIPPAAAASPPAAATPGASAVPTVRDGPDEVAWMWPAGGAVIAGFDEGRNKGLTIAGQAGDPVLAAGDGRVVYAGSSLRGYGNLIIVKHNEVYLTAYAHNQTLLVKDDQVVRRGQKIAEMGSSDADRVQLHFEIRRQGKPIDPARMLPPR